MHECKSIVAPAGCGKTQWIVRSVCESVNQKPILILTHTNAGVSALKVRLKAASANASIYSVYTIDSYLLMLVSGCPIKSGFGAEPGDKLDKELDYNLIRKCAVRLLEDMTLNALILATYSEVLVDEYQDCDIQQHKAIVALSTLLPTTVLGDPMQAIFGFKGTKPVEWDIDVVPHFMPSEELSTPWRWRNAGSDQLGQWLMSIRCDLKEERCVDVSAEVQGLVWIKTTGGKDYEGLVEALQQLCDKHRNMFVVGNSVSLKARVKPARRIWKLKVIDAVGAPIVANFARSHDVVATADLEGVLEFASEIMTGVRKVCTTQSVRTIRSTRRRRPVSEIDIKADEYCCAPSLTSLYRLLSAIDAAKETGRVVWGHMDLCLRSLKFAIENDTSFVDALSRMLRARSRASGRMPDHAFGSTLLLKGQECEAVVVLDADKLNAKELYVALTRGSKAVYVFSDNPVIGKRG